MPELPKREMRFLHLAELRADAGEGEQPHIRGYAALFDSWSEDLGWFREKIRPGAFVKTIQEADIRALWNHDPNYVLGRNRSETLMLREDEQGLAVDITPPDTQWARDLMTSMKRQDINQMSFAFQAVRDEWNHDSDPLERTLVECSLFDVAVVTYPAYTSTSGAVVTGAAGGSDKFFVLDVFRPLKRYVRTTLTRAVANFIYGGTIAIQYGAHKKPTIHDAATLAAAAILGISPADA
jgi:HK97 family phage prohead protease